MTASDEIHSIEEFYAYVETLPPEKKKLADNWCIGIGLQDVDHLSVSLYLLNLVQRNIEGELTIAEVEAMIQQYHNEKKKQEQAGQGANPEANDDMIEI